MSTRRGACLTLAALATLRPAQAAGNDIVVAQIGPFTGLPVPDASQINEGLRAAYAQANARGGVGGRRISLFEVDDTYTADGFVNAFAQAMKRRPVALMCPVGSVAIKRMLDDRLLDTADVLVLNAVPGAEALRNPGHPRLFHIRAGDRQQVEKIVEQAHGLGVGVLGVLHQDIPIGSSALAMAGEAVKRVRGMEIRAFQATNAVASVASAAVKLAEAGIQAVLVAGAPRFMADGVAELRKAGVRQFIFALSYAPAGLLVKVVGPGSRGVALAQTYPNPMGVAMPLQREFQAGMKAAAPGTTTYTSFHLEGYVCGRVFIEAARRARDIDAEGLSRSLRAMGELDLGGFRVDFSKANAGSRFVDIGVINADGRLVY